MEALRKKKKQQTWSSVGRANNAGGGYLSLSFKKESEMPQKEQQSHFSEREPVRKQRHNAN